MQQPPTQPLACIVASKVGNFGGITTVIQDWTQALRSIGFRVETVAGDADASRQIPAFGRQPSFGYPSWEIPELADVKRALQDADLIIVENLCSLPFHPFASIYVVEAARGHRTIFHHHDLPWGRDGFHDAIALPQDQDEQWAHITINPVSQQILRERGIDAALFTPRVDSIPTLSSRDQVRQLLGTSDNDILVTQSTRGRRSKRIHAGVKWAERLAERVAPRRVHFWLTGAASPGHEQYISESLGSAKNVVTHHGDAGTGAKDHDHMSRLYAASDVVIFPSDLGEGAGLPPFHGSAARRIVVVGDDPIVNLFRERYGFEWLNVNDPHSIVTVATYLERGGMPRELLERNAAVVRKHFALVDLPNSISELFRSQGWDDLLSTTNVASLVPGAVGVEVLRDLLALQRGLLD